MNRTTVSLLLAALCLTPACDWNQLPGPQAMQDVSAPPSSDNGEAKGPSCLKWSARPPSGISSGKRPW